MVLTAIDRRGLGEIVTWLGISFVIAVWVDFFLFKTGNVSPLILAPFHASILATMTRGTSAASDRSITAIINPIGERFAWFGCTLLVIGLMVSILLKTGRLEESFLGELSGIIAAGGSRRAQGAIERASVADLSKWPPPLPPPPPPEKK